MTDEIELPKCPFCGGTFELVKTIHQTINLCHKRPSGGRCIIARSNEFYTEDAAIEAINTRPIEDALRARIDELDLLYKMALGRIELGDNRITELEGYINTHNAKVMADHDRRIEQDFESQLKHFNNDTDRVVRA